MEVLAGRVLLHPADPEASWRFYRDVLGLAVYREFSGGVVFFLGGGFLEVSGTGSAAGAPNVDLWLQVRDVAAEHRRLAAAGVQILREPRHEPWGLVEMWIADPDGVRLVLVEVPEDHPLRRDTR
jgi:predicted enzyme related to lactoylglutathione lyase